jgi:hypothetical protein
MEPHHQRCSQFYVCCCAFFTFRHLNPDNGLSPIPSRHAMILQTYSNVLHRRRQFDTSFVACLTDTRKSNSWSSWSLFFLGGRGSLCPVIDTVQLSLCPVMDTMQLSLCAVIRHYAAQSMPGHENLTICILHPGVRYAITGQCEWTLSVITKSFSPWSSCLYQKPIPAKCPSNPEVIRRVAWQLGNLYWWNIERKYNQVWDTHTNNEQLLPILPREHTQSIGNLLNKNKSTYDLLTGDYLYAHIMRGDGDHRRIGWSAFAFNRWVFFRGDGENGEGDCRLVSKPALY